MPEDTATTWVWLSPQRLADRWHPGAFRPEYLELDRELASSASYVRLGDLVDVVSPALEKTIAKWHVQPSGVERRFRDTDTESGVSALPVTALPDEAILVSRSWFRDPVVRYWNSRVFHGDGTASWAFWVLKNRVDDGIGWIYREVDAEYVRRQMRRHSVGSVSANLSRDDLLDLRIRRLDDSTRKLVNRAVVEEAQFEAASSRSRRLKRPFVLTGRTFEERLRQFERFLELEGLFSPKDAFFVEPATRVNTSDLFTIRPIALPASPLSNTPELIAENVPSTSEAWRSWFWGSADLPRHQVFNSFLTEFELPTYLLARMLSPPPDAVVHSPRILVPAFSTFRDAVSSSIKADVGVEEQIWSDVWTGLQSTLAFGEDAKSAGPESADSTQPVARSDTYEFEQELFEWSRLAYRPILAIKVLREDVVVGAYLLFGGDQIEDRISAYAHLDDLGIALCEALYPPSELLEDTARRESLRRLSSVMHQIKAPVGRANNALSDVREFLDHNPDTASRLVPSEEKARRRARMPGGASLDRQTLAARLDDAQKAVNDIKKVAYQLIRLRRVQGKLEKKWCCLGAILRECTQRCRQDNPEILVDTSQVSDYDVLCNEESIRYAIDEVMDNSSRELRFREVESPAIVLKCGRDGDEVWFSISDNGLPESIQLIDDPFEEGVTTYERKGHGTGLGLTIVRETFLSHGGDCSLQANFEGDERIAGTTFTAHIRVAHRPAAED